MFTPHPSSRTLPFVPDFYYKRVVDVPNGTGKLTGPGATLKNGTGEMNGNGSDLKKFPSNADSESRGKCFANSIRWTAYC